MVTRKELAPPVPGRAEVTFDDVLGRLDAHGRPYDRDLLSAVYSFSAERHHEQTRRSGEPFLIHPLHVAYLLAD
jgi:GTP pyrophosphokinase